MTPPRIDSDALYPRDEMHRYRIYALEDGRPVVRATAATNGGVGLAIMRLARERAEAGLKPEVVAVNDGVERKWLTTLWPEKGGAS